MKKFLFSFVLASVSVFSFAQGTCASTFNVLNNGAGGSCDQSLASDANYKRDGLVEIRFAAALAAGITPEITAIYDVTPAGLKGNVIDMKFSYRRFSNANRTTVEYCFYSKNNLNLKNASGSRYQVDITYTTSTGSTSTTCVIEQATAPIGLPVTFGDFAAQRKSYSSVFLKWSTLSEQNNKGFYVQRNTGNGWKDAGFVFSQTANGYSSSELNYEFKDVNSEKATTQYRILQVDNSGYGKYSDVRLVRGEAGSGKVVLYPNPTNTGKVSIAFESNGERDITVHDMSGRIVKQLTKVTNSNVVIDGLTSGFYTIQMVDRATSEVTREKLVVNNK